MESTLKKSIFQLDYSIHQKSIHIYATAGIIANILFYIINAIQDIAYELIILRVLAIVMYLVIVFFPRDNWKLRHKVYYELAMLITVPYTFLFMLLYTNVNILWASGFIFGALIYAAFSKTIVAAHGFASSFLVVYLVYNNLYGNGSEVMEKALPVILIAILGFVFATIMKIQFEMSFFKRRDALEEIHRINETFSSLIYISSELAMYDDLDELYHILIQRLNYLFPDSSLALLITKDTGKVLNQVYHGVTSEDQKFINQNYMTLIDSYALHEAAISKEETALFEQWLVFNKDYSIRSITGKRGYNISLFIKDTSISDLELNAFQIFMEQVKGAVRTRFQSIELEHYATTDPLTGLYNRSSFYEVFKSFEYLHTPRVPFSIIFGDVNGLKRINDTYGHTAGDLLLQTCSRTVQESLSKGERAFRYGGDEFIIIAENTCTNNTDGLIQHLQEAFAGKTIICVNEITEEKRVEEVSMCFGGACSSEAEFDELIDLADARMLEKKKIFYENQDHIKYR